MCVAKGKLMPDNEKHPRSSPQTFTLQFGRPWTVLRPRVYRYLEAEYVEAFFKDGSLRLSSFSQFAKHPDEQRKDTAEGTAMKFGLGSQATIAIVGSTGHNCYVLCGTLHNIESVRTEFKQYDACIAIDDVAAFANAVSLRISFFTSGLEGPTLYQDARMINKNLGDIKAEDIMAQYKNADGTVKIEMIFDAARMLGGVEEFFIKHSQYAKQCEYRLLWAAGQQVEPFIDIKVPEAVKFCRHVTTEN